MHSSILGDDDIDNEGVAASDSDDDAPGRKRRKKDDDNETNLADSGEPKMTAEEEKAKADELWAQLNAEDVKPKVSQPLTSSSTTSSSSAATLKVEVKKEVKKEETVKSPPPPATSSLQSSIRIAATSGLSGLAALRQASASRSQAPPPAKSRLAEILGKNKNQPSTLMKTKADWEKFKADEGLAEELKEHTRSKDSYVERQAFLQRADVRQFEQEKSVRDRNRARAQLNQK